MDRQYSQVSVDLDPKIDVASLRSWSRHNTYTTPKSMKGVWRTSYQSSFNGKQIGYQPDRYIVDYFSGTRSNLGAKGNQADVYKGEFNKRAKNGFRYWCVDKPRPSHFGKYGTGSYKTVLGIGNAPRS